MLFTLLLQIVGVQRDSPYQNVDVLLLCFSNTCIRVRIWAGHHMTSHLTRMSHDVSQGHPITSDMDIPWHLTETSHDVWHWHPMASHRHIPWRLTLTSHGVSQAHPMTSHSVIPWCLTVILWCLTGMSHDISQGCPMTSHRDVPWHLTGMSHGDDSWKHPTCFTGKMRPEKHFPECCMTQRGQGKGYGHIAAGGTGKGGFTKYGTVTTTRIVVWGGHMLLFYFIFLVVIVSLVASGSHLTQSEIQLW